MIKAFLITNPKSGGYNQKKIEFMRQKLEQNNIFVVIHNLAEEEKIVKILENISSSEYQILLLAFGDGTINSACNALMEKNDYEKFKIGIIPMGTANVLSAELGVNKFEKLLKAIINNRTKKMYLGELFSDNHSRYFSLMASAGVDSIVVQNIDENLKKKIGKFAYIFEFLKILFTKKFEKIKTVIDKQTHENVLTCVSNSKYYGGRFKVADTTVDKNEFEVIIFNKFSVFSILKYIFTGKSENIQKFTAKDIEIKSNKENFPLQLDGDYYCNLPVKINISDKYLNVFYN